MPRSQGAKWVVDYDRGSWDATRNGRAFGVNYHDIEEAVAAIKKSPKYEKGDSIKAYDEFGNRVLIRT